MGDVLQTYLDELATALDDRYDPTPELSARPAFHQMLRSFTDEFNGLRITVEPSALVVGRPDFAIKTSAGRSLGYIETKAPGPWSAIERELESEQLQRYRTQLRNVILTDYVHAILIRDGREVARAGLLPRLVPGRKQRASEGEKEQFAALFAQFLSVAPDPIRNPQRLATLLASYAAVLRIAMEDHMAAEEHRGPLRTLFGFFQRYLQPGATHATFADAIAQALTYSLFVARLSLRERQTLTIANAPALMPDSLAFLRAFVKLVEDTDALGTVEWALREVCDVLISTPDEVLREAGHMGSSAREDTIIYFYEKFLEAYDREARIDRGVYYTPPPLVDFIVRGVDRLLRTAFNLERGLADSRVTLLDPACGTGTFLVSAAACALNTVRDEDGIDFVPSAIEQHVLPHYIGFELQPGPYTVSHIKLVSFLAERAPSIRKQLLKKLRPRIYLSNTLSPAGLVRSEGEGAGLPIVREVVQEGLHANKVKQTERIMVIMGNPPYKREPYNKNDFIDALLDDFFFIGGRRIDEKNTTPLQSDELRFLRWAVWKLMQEQSHGYGIVAFVTNHAFVRRRLHRGVRKFLLDRFDDIYVFDLMGNQRAYFSAHADEKVFAQVQQGVCICLLVKRPKAASTGARVLFRRIQGTREEKFEALDRAEIDDAGWEKHGPVSPRYSFVPRAQSSDDYDGWPKVTELFGRSNSGIITGADQLLVSTSSQELERRMRHFLGPKLDRKSAAEKFGVDISKPRSWLNTVDAKRRQMRFDRELIRQCTFRPGDKRYVYFAYGLVKEYRKDISNDIIAGPNLVLAVGSGGSPEAPYAWVGDSPMPQAVLSQRTHGRAELFPARTYPAGALDLLGSSDNLSRTAIAFFNREYGWIPSGEDLIGYVYGALWSMWWRESYAQLAYDEDDLPRIPLPADRAAFDHIATIGTELVQLHRLVSAKPAKDVRAAGDPIIGRWSYDPLRRVIELKNGATIGPILAEDASFAVGGYVVLRQWFEAREGAELGIDDLVHLRKLIGAMRATPAVVARLDKAFAECADHDGFAAWDIESQGPEPIPLGDAADVHLPTKRATAKQSSSAVRGKSRPRR